MRPLQTIAGILTLTGCASTVPLTPADVIVNPGFEQGWEGWTSGDTEGAAVSDVAHAGAKAIKLNQKSAFVSQVVELEPNRNYQLQAFVRGPDPPLRRRCRDP
ncbi:MAG: carbohydrate binding domain-containing protein, partial [Myxococcota bacterium]